MSPGGHMRIGQLSDIHLKGSADRRDRLMRSLAHAQAMKVDHLVLTGDLTSRGRASELEELASCLSGWPSEKVTVVPGNHDAGTAFDQALRGGSLSRFAVTSLSPVRLGGLRIIPIDTRFSKRALLFRAVGQVGRPQLEWMAMEIADRSGPVLIAAHHGPQWHPLHAFDGLSDRAQVLRLMGLREDVHIISGHDHRVLDIGRVHVAASVAHHPDPLRTYLFRDGRLYVEHKSEQIGNYMTFGRRVF